MRRHSAIATDVLKMINQDFRYDLRKEEKKNPFCRQKYDLEYQSKDNLQGIL